MTKFKRTKETIAINNALKIDKLTENVKFLSKDKKGYYLPAGYCFWHPQKGYLAFAGAETPYIPAGGEKALKSIMEGGGFIDFDTAVWLKPHTA